MDKKIYDVGDTKTEVLYDFAVLLSHCDGTCIDRNSELGKAFEQLLHSAWASLPDVVTIDFRSME